MATQLFLLDGVADTHLGTDNLLLTGSASTTGFASRALGLARGSLANSIGVATVTGATPGVEPTISGARAEFISPPIAADVTISGTITANIWASENNMSANAASNVIIEIIRANTTTTRNSNTLVEIVRSTNAVEMAVTTAAAANFTSGMTSGGYTGQTLNRGDRLRIRMFADDVGAMATGFSLSFWYNGPTAAASGDSYVTFTENITFESGPFSSTGSIVNAPSFVDIDNIQGSGGTAEQAAQSFPSDSSASVLSSVTAYIHKSSAPTDNLIIEIQSDSGGAPSGSVVGTVATIAGASLTTTNTGYTYPCSIALAASSTYWIVYRRSGARDTTNFFRNGVGSNYANGDNMSMSSGVWAAAASAGDGKFEVTWGIPGSTVYLTDTASAVSTASVDREAWTSRGAGVQTDVVNTAAGWTAPIQLSDTAGGTVVDWFTRPLTAFTLTGMAVANLRALESNAAANASLRCQIARVAGDGTSPTVWADWAIAPTSTDNGELTTSEVARTANVSGDDLAITNGQRLRIRVYADDISSAAMGASQTVTLYYAGTSGGASGDTYITFPQTLTEYASGPFTYTKAGYGKEAG